MRHLLEKLRSSMLGEVAGLVLLTLAYAATAKLGLLLATVHGNVSPVWPATGLAIAAVRIWGPRAALGVLAGAYLANRLTPVPWFVAAGIAVGNTLEALVGSWVIGWVRSRREAVLGPVLEGGATIAAAVLGPLLSATVGVASLLAAGFVPAAAARYAWATWWVGNALGAVLVAPVLLVFSSRWTATSAQGAVAARLSGSERLLKVVLLSCATGVVCGLVFFRANGANALFLIFPLLLLASRWLGPAGGRLVALAVEALSIVGAFYGKGPFVAGSLNENLLHLQVFLAAVGVTVLALEVFMRQRNVWLPGLILLAGWSLSGWLFATLRDEHKRQDQAHFEDIVADAEHDIEQRMATYKDGLRGGMSLFAASASVERHEWRAYVEALRMREHYPGVHGLGVVFPVRPDTEAEFLARTRADGAPEFRIRPVPGVVAPEGDEKFVITFLEPVTINQAAVGLDLASESVRKEAAVKARDSGEPVMTGRITLVQDHQQRPGFLLYSPVYRKQAAVQTVEQRRGALEAWVYAPFVTENFLAGGLGARVNELRLWFYDGGLEDPDNLLYSTTPGPLPRAGFEKTSTMELAGRQFTLGWSRAPGFVRRSDTAEMLVACAAALISVLLAGLVMSLQSVGLRANAIAMERTAELQSSEERFRSLAASSPVGIFLADATGACTYTNERWQEIYGLSAEQGLGGGWASCLHPEDRDRVFLEWQRTAMEHGEMATEFRLLREGGEVRFVHARVRLVRGTGPEGMAFVGCIEDVTARHQVATEMMHAKELAEAASRAKSDFLATMSHEIRTPMNGVLGFTGLLLESGLNEEQLQFAQIIQRSGSALLTLINDILDFSKIEAGKMDLESVPCNLAAIARDVVAVVSPTANAKKLELVFEAPVAGVTDTLGDPGRLRQVMLNIVGNAVKFTESGSVRVRLGTGENGFLRVSVSDTGIGISADKQALLFQKFSQVDGSATRRFGGTGLGLAISKRLVEVMGGQIGVVSQQGQGSEFWFTLPPSAAEAKPAGAPAQLAAAPQVASGAVKAGTRVLLVEDSMVNQLLAKRVLEKLGCEVDLADNGVDALKLFQQNRYGLVLMDCHMPMMDGYETTKCIRQLQTTGGRVPIFALTASVMEEDRERCEQAGMDGFLEKPVDYRALSRVVGQLNVSG